MSTDVKIKGQSVQTFNADHIQGGTSGFAIPITTKVDDTFPSDNSTTSTSLVVTGIVNELVGGKNVQAYELSGQTNTVNAQGIASQINIVTHFEKQTGMFLDSHMMGKVGDPVAGVATFHLDTTALDLFIPENGISSTVITNPTQQDIQNINQAKANQTIAAEVNVGTGQSTTESIDNNVSVQTTQNTPDSLNVNVSAPSQTSPKVIAFNLNATTINVANLKDLGIMYDGKPILPAPNMDAILHAKSTDNPSFAIVVTQSGVQVLVLVPHFSTHSITITNMSKVITPTIPEFPFATIALVIAIFSIVVISKMKQFT